MLPSSPTALSLLGWECWDASQIRPWGRWAQSHVDVDVVGAESSPTGEPTWESTLTTTVPWVTRRRGWSHCQRTPNQAAQWAVAGGFKAQVCVFRHAHSNTDLLANPCVRSAGGGGECWVLLWKQHFFLAVTSRGRNQVKVVEDTYGQREERLRLEKEQLMAQLLLQSQDAERARAELLAQHQQRLATLEQQNKLEMERLQELQR